MSVRARRQIPGRALDPEFVRIVLELEEDTLYPPSAVARRIADPGSDTYDRWRKKVRAWIKYHCSEPNGKAGRYNAWLGSTWQEFLDPVDKATVLQALEAERQAREAAELARRRETERIARAEARRKLKILAVPLAAAAAMILFFSLNKPTPVEPVSVAETAEINMVLDGAEFLAKPFLQDDPAPVESAEDAGMSYADFASFISDREPLRPMPFVHRPLHVIDREAAVMTLVFNENPKPEQALFLLDSPISIP